MNGDLPAELARQAQPLLDAHPGLLYRWEMAGTSRSLTFPPTQPDGFEVTVEAEMHALRVHGLGFHTHLDWHDTAAEAVADALGLARDLLSTSMRVREVRAGNRPVRWELQAAIGGEWKTEQVTSLAFWNYFAPRSAHLYQNDTLPSRARPSDEH